MRSTVFSDEEFSNILNDFPALKRNINGKRLVYLDNAASTLKCKSVIEKMTDFYLYHYSNIHRAVHTLAGEATVAYEQAREKVANFLNASSEEIIFTSGTTMGINFLVNSLVKSGILKTEDTVLISQVEHHANLVPWVRLSKFYGFKVAYITADEKGVITNESILKTKESIPNPKVVSITGQSNVTGQEMPIELIRETFKNATLIVDGAQLVPHKKVDVKKFDVDFLVFSGHKMLGPTGIGVLYGKKALLEQLEPFLYGGEMIDKVTFEDVTFNVLPYRFEAGTQHITGAVGLGYTIDYLESIGFEKVEEHVEELSNYLLEKMMELDFVEIYGPIDSSHKSLVSFNVKGVHPHDVSHILDENFGVATRSGHHCAQPLMGVLAKGSKIDFPNSTVRASVYLYNTKEDIDVLIEGLKYIRRWFE
ncbi:cysteine desulfurase / selenocysteine lyase [Fervidobacterium changbaicum]|uniref:Cysteine desulfurase n=1 Tax=Fervidobacterium changbaicum TaxID=310769 RepID=A0ABX5QT73_9BACT|nr:SufS family cysteine desulfurase [Fervidobacterium changbaicum]QAV33300.1 SufS family cysteine desulfurase [Fervidobacterium changbaicum]SDH07952.1 cysteine desulfurase / selenocysteine lyase [Fervidobacterium changbaicum]